MLAGIIVNSVHLLVEDILYETPEVNGHLILEALFLGSLNGSLLGPLAKHGRAVQVAVVAEGCVGQQPLLVVLAELLERGTTADSFPLLIEEHAQIVHLSLEHAFIVYL